MPLPARLAIKDRHGRNTFAWSNAMKNMKKLPLIVMIGSLAACGGGDLGMSGMGTAGSSGATFLTDTTVTTPPAGTTPAGAASSAQGATASDDSSAFLATAYQDGLAEIQLSQLAQQRASSESVKKFAQRMIDQHTALNNAITQLAQTKSIALPSAPSSDLQEQLSSLSAQSGDQFDRAYMRSNVTAHEKDSTAARLQSQQGTDQDVRMLAMTTLPLLKTHLAAAEEISAQLDPASFLATAHRAGLAEIQLAQLALEKASNERVRSFAQRMVDEHTQADTQLSTLAQQKGVTLTDTLSPQDQATLSELENFSGADFDEAYMDANVIGHVKAVRLFRKQAKSGLDNDVKAYAADTEPRLTEHLLAAHEVDQQVDPSFPFRIYQDGAAEIIASQLALRLASNNEVKAYAQRMINEHTAPNRQLQTQAQQAGRALPTELGPEHLLAVAALATRSGQEFDQGYMELNVRVHERDVRAATTASQQTEDALANTAAQAALPILNEHLAAARTLRDTVNATGQQSQ
jgi:predicted outer membrane protein